MQKKRHYKYDNKPSYFDDEVVREIEYLIYHGHADFALEKCEKYIQDYPNDDLGPFYLAKAYSALKRIEESLEIAKEAYETRSFYNESARVKASMIYAEVLSNNNLHDEAIAVLEKEISRDNNFNGVRLRLEYLKLLNVNEEFDKSMQAVNTYIQKRDLPVFHIKKGLIYYLQGMYSDAINELKDIQDSDNQTNQQQKYYYLGRSYFELHKQEKYEHFLYKADDSLHKALTIKNRFYYSACSALAGVNMALERIDEAKKYANIVIDNKDYLKGDLKKVDDAYKTLSNIYLIEGKIDKSLEAIQNIEKEFDHDMAFLRHLLYTKQYDAYLEKVNHVLSITPEQCFKVAIQEYIAVLLRVGKLDEALYVIECLKDDINYPYYERVIAYIRKEKGEEPLDYRYYTSKQIANYSFEDAVKHVCEGHINGHEIRATFSCEDDARNALLEAKEAIKDLDFYPSVILNKYTIIRDDIGKDKFGKVNGMVAVVIPNTDNIITLYPINSCISDYEDEFVPKKVKRLSQIEKFNQKYKK